MSEKLTRTQIKNLERLGGVNPADQPFSRRQFLNQVGGYGLVAGGAVGAGLLLRDHWGMEGVKPPPRSHPAGRTSSWSGRARYGRRNMLPRRRNCRRARSRHSRW